MGPDAVAATMTRRGGAHGRTSDDGAEATAGFPDPVAGASVPGPGVPVAADSDSDLAGAAVAWAIAWSAAAIAQCWTGLSLRASARGRWASGSTSRT